MPLFDTSVAEEQPTSLFGSSLPTGGIFGGTAFADLAPDTAVKYGLGYADSAATAVQGYGSSPLGINNEMQMMEMMMQAGIPLDTDPSLIDTRSGTLRTPETARAETEQGIVKLATINPELAEAMAARLEGQEEDKGFWDNLKDLAGDILSPVVSIGAKALDILSRPGHIVPELMRNDDDDPWYEDIGQALGGHSTATWSKVLKDRYGWENNFVTGAVGFVGDVLTDPLSWIMTPGRVGVDVALNAGEAVAKKTLSEAAEKAGLGLTDDYIENAYRHFVTSTAQRGARGSADFNAATFVEGLNGVPLDMVQKAVQMGDMTTTALQRTGKVQRELIARGVDPAEVARITEFLASKGKGFGKQARYLAGATGGMRLKAGVPFTQYRFTSGAIPGTGRFGFDVPRNFFRGFSGYNRLQKAVDGGMHGASVKDLDNYYQFGIKGIMRENPDLARYMSGGVGSHLGQPLYAMSHRMGKVTGYMSTHSHVYRSGGLIGLYAMRAGRDAKGLRSKVIEDAWTIRNEDGTIKATPRQFEASIRTLRSDPESVDKYHRYLAGEDVPMSKHEVEAIDNINRSFDQTSRVLESYGIPPQVSTTTIEAAAALNRTDVGAWQRGTVIGDGETFYASAVPSIDNQAHYGTLGGRGWRVMAQPSPGAVPVRIRTTDPFIIREGQDLTDLPIVQGKYDEIYAELDEQAEMIMKTHGWGEAEWLKQRTWMADKKFTAWATAQGKDAIVHMDETGKVTRATIFRTEVPGRGMNVKVLDDSMESVGEGRGVPQMLSKAYREARWGANPSKQKMFIDELPEDERKLLYAAANPADREQLLRDALRGKEFGGNVFETELRTIAADYAGWAGNEVAKRQLGFAGRKLNRLVGTEGIGGAVTAAVWADKTTTIADDVVRELDSEVREVIAKHGLSEELANDSVNEIAVRLGSQFKRISEELDAFVDDPSAVYNLRKALEGKATAARQVLLNRKTQLRKEAAQARSTAKQLKKLDDPAGDEYRNLLRALNDGEGDIDPKTALFMAGWEMHRNKLHHYRGGGEALGTENAIKAAAERGEDYTASRVAKYTRLEGEFRKKLADSLPAGSALKKALKKEVDPAPWLDDSVEDVRSAYADMLAAGRPLDEISAEQETIEKQLNMLDEMIAKGDGTTMKGMDPEVVAARNRVRAYERNIAAKRREKGKIEAALNEVNKIHGRYRAKTQAAPKAALIEVTDNLPPGYDVIKGIPEMAGFAAHPYIAAEFRNALKGNNINPLRKAWREWFQGPWKRWATIYYPGFHARNFMGAWFNNWLGGVGMTDYNMSHKLSRALKGDTKYSIGGAEQYMGEKTVKELGLGWMFENPKEATWEELGYLLHTQAVRASNSQGFADIYDHIRELKRMSAAGNREGTRKARQVLGKPGRAYGRVARAGTELTENFFRQAAYIQGLRVTGGDPHGARMFTMIRHGDYEDLNDFEEGMKDLLPFYKWMRTNLPYQIHNILENPGKQLAVLKAKDAVYTMQGLDPYDERNKQADYVKDAFTIPLPFGAGKDEALTMAVLDLPMSDLHQGANDFISSALPLLRPAFESFIAEKNLFTGQDLEDRLVPLAGWADMPGIRDVLEATGWVKRDVDGKPVISDKTQNMMSMIPVFSRFRNWVFSDPKSAQKRLGAITSTLFGIRIQNQGATELMTAERAFMAEEVEPIINQYEELGIKFPAIDEISPEVWQYLGFTPPVDEETTVSANPFAAVGA